MMKRVFTAVVLLGTASMAQAVTVQWASLTAQPNATTVTGTVAGVGMTYSGAINFTQLNNTGTVTGSMAAIRKASSIGRRGPI